MNEIEIVGASKNNLRVASVSFAPNQITVVTGVSGSGKSSLLQGTLAAEGQRRMRSFLGFGNESEDCDAFIGPLPPVLHVGQRGFRASSRTTVGTATGILGTLRRLFVAVAGPWSGDRRVPPPSPESYAAWLGEFYRGRAVVWATMAAFTSTDGTLEAAKLAKAGISTVGVRRESDAYKREKRYPTAGFKALSRSQRYLIEAHIGELEITGPDPELEGLLRTAFALAPAVVVELPAASCPALLGPWGHRLDSSIHHVLPHVDEVFAPPSSSLLSFNQPEQAQSGACPRCGGLGRSTDIDVARLVARPDRSMHEGAFVLWAPKAYTHVNIRHETIEGLRGMAGFDPDLAWEVLPPSAQRLVLDGADEIVDRDRGSHRALSKPSRFPGFRDAILRRAKGARSAAALEPLVTDTSCPDCNGSRWSAAARALRVDGLDMPTLLGHSMAELEQLARTRLVQVPGAEASAQRLAQQAAALVSVGLGHLQGDRGMTQVSSGESRRARLAAVLNAGHAGLCLLLDEPARGLHEEDIGKLADALQSAAGRHTVVVNEHREGVISRAHRVLELGPGAGAAGGRVVRHARPIPDHQLREVARHPVTKWLELEGVSIHNVEEQAFRVPLGAITCFTGLSGSGKSSLVWGGLLPALAQSLGVRVPEDAARPGGTWGALRGAPTALDIVVLDQRPPQPNRRSLVATYIGVADEVRAAFAASPAARFLGLSPADFGLNSGTGRCNRCAGLGEVDLGNETEICPACSGTRYSPRALSVRVEGLTVHDVLDLPISDLRDVGRTFLAGSHSLLDVVQDVGVGHLSLGRRIDTLSGGEVQRLRIAQRLAAHQGVATLFALDEPAAGLHPRDVAMLMRAVERALDGGRNTVILIEHNLDIISQADHLVEVGPGSGAAGGRVLAEGPPSVVAQQNVPTGRALRARSDARQFPSPKVVAAEPSLRANRWLHGMIDPEIAPQESDELEALCPVVDIASLDLDTRRWLEVGDLHIELNRLLIEVEGERRRDELVDILGSMAPNTKVYLHPTLPEMQVWGDRLPKTLIDEARREAGIRGSPWVETPGGERIEVGAVGDVNDRQGLLDRALRQGGGYVEARTGSAMVSGGPRLVDLHIGAVAPSTVSPEHASRLSSRGWCAMCRGRGEVRTVGEHLFVGNGTVPPTDEGFLLPAAAAVMKSVRRSALVPFFRRMSSEGLWDEHTPYERLGAPDRSILLYGFWHRPGHGSFVKQGKKDLGEVDSWLRWDGLIGALEAEAPRSKDSSWPKAMGVGVTHIACPTCDGTGVGVLARLLRIGERTLHELVLNGTASDLIDQLRGLNPRSDRARRRRDRLISCLEPVALAVPSLGMRDSAPTELQDGLIERLARSFTTMHRVP